MVRVFIILNPNTSWSWNNIYLSWRSCLTTKEKFEGENKCDTTQIKAVEKKNIKKYFYSTSLQEGEALHTLLWREKTSQTASYSSSTSWSVRSFSELDLSSPWRSSTHSSFTSFSGSPRDVTRWRDILCSLLPVWVFHHLWLEAWLWCRDLRWVGTNDLTSGCQNSNSASSWKFHHFALALLVALVLH